MTNFDDRYRLLKCVALGGGMRTHNAQEKATGRPVMVHIVDAPDSDVVERLREQVRLLPSADRSRIVEMAETPNGFVVVSEFLPGLTTFRNGSPRMRPRRLRPLPLLLPRRLRPQLRAPTACRPRLNLRRRQSRRRAQRS